MHANLVSTPRFQMYIHKRGTRHELEGVVVRDRSLSPVNHRHAPFSRGVASNRCVNRSRGRVWVSGNHRVVDLAYSPFLEGALHHRIGEFGLGHHHCARGSYIQSMNNSLTFNWSMSSDSISRCREVANNGRSCPSWTRVRCNTNRLVDNDNIVIVVENIHPHYWSYRSFRFRDRNF